MASAPSVSSVGAVFVVGSSIEPQIGERENSNWRFRVFSQSLSDRSTRLSARQSSVGGGDGIGFLKSKEDLHSKDLNLMYSNFPLSFVVKLGLAKGKSRSTENDGGAEYQKTRSSDGYRDLMVGPWPRYGAVRL